MRLKHIKLSGFKSFVDPTHVHFPSKLSGVVGPNGCGKSNIIDAVRWVMGESSAKHLRGESIADVIFNGTTGRSPVGQASVELVFDNTFGKLTGEYASYNEIAIRRLVNREGQSLYYLNNTRCRRRDIMDIFRGTGLGPRSYAIIEQGMISRLIEAKPEELRNYLEEAAGITKYKDRRRETELRIEHTKTNLSRLADLREELGNQLERLQRQAKAAEKYKEYKQEEQQVTAELYALRWQTLNEEIKQQQQRLSQLLLNYERCITEQTSTQSQIEQIRVSYAESHEELQSVQANYYAASAELSRIEQEINHLKQRQQTLHHDLQEAQQHYHNAKTLTETDISTIRNCEQNLAELEPQLSAQQSQLLSAQQTFEQAEKALQLAQKQYTDLQQQAAQTQKQDELLKVQMQHTQEQLQQIQQRIHKLEVELQSCQDSTLLETQQTLEMQLKQDALHMQEMDVKISQQSTALSEQQQKNQQTRQELNQLRTQLHQLQGQQASLAALQEAALGRDDQTLNAWLAEQELNKKPRLAEGLQVNPEWELAVECVLSKFLPAVMVNEFQSLDLSQYEKLPGKLSLYAASYSGEELGHEVLHPNWPALHDQITGEWSIASLITGIYCAKDLATALALREELRSFESFITPQGIWVGKDWLYTYEANANETGILARQQQLQTLEEQILICTQQVNQLVEQLELGEKEIIVLDQQRESLRSDYQLKQKQSAQQQAQLKEIITKIDHQQHRKENIQQELSELQTRARDLQEKSQNWEAEIAVIVNKKLELQELQQNYFTQRENAQAHLIAERENINQLRDNVHHLSVKVNAEKSNLQATQSSLNRIEQQLQDLEQRQQSIQENLNRTNEPLALANEQISTALEKQVAAEQIWSAKRDNLAEIEKTLHELEQLHRTQTQQTEAARNELETARLSMATTETRCATVTEQLQELAVDVQALLTQMTTEANESTWAEKLEGISQRIKRLGAINLAAIEEFSEASERKQFLDTQYEDVQQALNTLEEAIQKIDQETRSSFKQTYNTVNDHLKELFPKVFGGGEAYLELTDADVLSAGVRVIARPPGKKNSSIHLLSGGEKALTAIALVFSFFNLQPSPFCMLDEVDAPLDDANVGRFCQMVRQMSEKVQFIVITHNKITMEMTEHLTGVTMREPGVSRLVSVNVEQAAELAAS